MNTRQHVNGIGFDARQAAHEDIDQWRPTELATGVLWIVIPSNIFRSYYILSDIDVTCLYKELTIYNTLLNKTCER